MNALDSCSASPLSLMKDKEELVHLLRYWNGPCGWTPRSRQSCAVHLHMTLPGRDGNAEPLRRTREEANRDVL